MPAATALLLAGLLLAGCARAPAAEDSAAAPPAAASSTPTAGTGAGDDPELAALRRLHPPEACQLLPVAQLGTVFPGQSFKVQQALPPRLSGYAWDSRCSYAAGIGSIAQAPTTPTHTVDLFVRTPATPEKARANLAERHRQALTTTGYQPLPQLGEDAHAVSQTGLVSVWLVKGGSELQLNASDIQTPNAEKLRRLVALAQAL
ncbi:hypothetical protein [Thermomonas flagellata]|uniref:hypothetical protein n=1 Tax=Thermomonas flagellata TaxID=2888524 RepID=UPI001F039D6D|nr:hypothetical protein [Thermomonas flagellata]